MTINAIGITKRYGDFVALDDVSLEVAGGELTALLGPSGSGKSTLLRVIAGLERQDAGEVVISGEDLTTRPARERGVGFVFQHYAAFKHMTVRDNVAFGLSIRKRPKAEIAARVDELLHLVQLDGLAERYPSQLSGGQRQRMALARALAVEPKVLLLDEPFGALDARVRKELRAWLRRLHEEMHVTTVFVTHDQEEAMEVADRIVIMNEGRIEQIGPPRELYERPGNEFVMSFLGPVNKLGDVLVRPARRRAPAGAQRRDHRGARRPHHLPRLRGARRARAPQRAQAVGADHARGGAAAADGHDRPRAAARHPHLRRRRRRDGARRGQPLVGPAGDDGGPPRLRRADSRLGDGPRRRARAAVALEQQRETAQEQHRRRGGAQHAGRRLDRELRAEQHARDRAHQQRGDHPQVDVAHADLREAGDDQQDHGVEDVGADDPVGGQRIEQDEEHGEHRAAADRGEADDEARADAETRRS